MLQIYVRVGSSEPRALELAPDATVADLLAAAGAPPHSHLLFSGQRLEDKKQMLADAGLSNEVTVDIPTQTAAAWCQETAKDAVVEGEDCRTLRITGNCAIVTGTSSSVGSQFFFRKTSDLYVWVGLMPLGVAPGSLSGHDYDDGDEVVGHTPPGQAGWGLMWNGDGTVTSLGESSPMDGSRMDVVGSLEWDKELIGIGFTVTGVELTADRQLRCRIPASSLRADGMQLQGPVVPCMVAMNAVPARVRIVTPEDAETGKEDTQ
eukprot:TRINITY_DN14564_c0_g1_i3.p1 TRINITY_DN14564_c0_g1~~TRINITY_DN14564_c0_g1_i3.p1  ORF type:complete len:290 (+),score=81.60 TRINITY_DN14564_c0_g1_i3:82-870(+)